MYCNNCGKHNPEGSKFCQHCGFKIEHIEERRSSSKHNKVQSSEQTNSKVEENNNTVKAGLNGWLAVVGLGLILTLLIQGYGLFGYFPLFNQTYDIPGYVGLLQFEFVMALAITMASIYLLYLYFKKNKKFPKFYITFLIVNAVYVTLDHIILASLTAPTPEQQKIISDTLSSHSSEVGRAIFFAIIWVWYTIKSKRVKATFVNN